MSNGNDAIYFDHSATTKPLSEVVEVMNGFLQDAWGNPSSLYATGRRVRSALEEARGRIATILGADAKEIIFTGSGSESDNLAIKGVAESLAVKGNHIVTLSIEHPAVLETCHHLEKRGFEVTYVDPEPNGIASVQAIEQAITDKTILVSVMMANNVIGTVQPIKEIAAMAHSKGVLVHTDAVQAAGTLPIDAGDLGVDLLSISAHKFHGPKGVGALYVRKGTRLKPLVDGGGQEQGKRSGTENVPGILGMAKALEIADAEMSEKMARMRNLRDKLVEGVLAFVPDSLFIGDSENRLPGSACFTFRYVEGESIVLHLDMMGIATSSGSACASQALEPSHVLLRTGVSIVDAHGSLRVTLGRSSTGAEVDRFLEVLPGVINKLREMSPFSKGNEPSLVAEESSHGHGADTH